MYDYTHPLVLTTPLVRGPRVVEAQRLLSGHNHFNPVVHTYRGRLDGIYGPATAAATKLAKYWLGYSTGAQDHRFGQLIYNLLNGKSRLSADYLERRKERLAAADDPIKKKAFILGAGQVGYHETPFGSNLQKYGEWYGFNGVPWCDIFVSWCISHSGRLWKYALVADTVLDAQRGRNGMSITYSPEHADLVSYTTAHGPNQHIAFFDHWIDSKHHTFADLGGNTGPTDMSNGGAVMRQERHIEQVTHFIRLNF